MRVSEQWRYDVSAFLPGFRGTSVDILPTTGAPVFGCLSAVPFVFHCPKRSDA